MYELDAIEQVQRYFTRRLNGLKMYSYTERLFLLGLESLELRRLKIDLCVYFKILHNLIDVEINDFFIVRENNHNTRGHNFTLRLNCSNVRNNRSRNLFRNRNVNCWNNLPYSVVNSDLIAIFKRELNKIDLHSFLKGHALE